MLPGPTPFKPLVTPTAGHPVPEMSSASPWVPVKAVPDSLETETVEPQRMAHQEGREQ